MEIQFCFSPRNRHGLAFGLVGLFISAMRNSPRDPGEMDSILNHLTDVIPSAAKRSRGISEFRKRDALSLWARGEFIDFEFWSRLKRRCGFVEMLC